MEPWVKKEVIGNATLYLGDCLSILPHLPKVDAVITDPPYGIAHLWKGGFSDKHGWGKAKDESITRNEWDDKPLDEAAIGILLDAGSEHIIWGGNYFPLPRSRCWLVWNKPERNFTLAEAELAWTSKDAVVRVFDGPRSDQGREHPTQKPVSLMRWCVAKTTGTVCDPFMGSGTTGVACMELNRPFIGIEVEPKYYEMARVRIENAQRQQRMFA
jgi:site-specific DNA-methyltransferase (adenine-specific)